VDVTQSALLGVILLLAALNLVNFGWIYYLSRALKAKEPVKTYQVRLEGAKVLNADDMAAIAELAKSNLKGLLDQQSTAMVHDLGELRTRVVTQVEQTAQNALTEQLEQYHISLEALRNQAIQTLSGLQTDLDKRRADLMANLEAQVKAEEEKLMDQFGAKLSDTVAAYLIESLGNNVDLGAQSQYIFDVLNEHKAELKREVLE
jgi:F0F1-type ATP synthase membrane subunit b/b'